MTEKTVEIGYEDVLIIDKLYGPTIFANLRITPDLESGDWVICREWVATGKWVEWCRIPGQVSEEFTKQDEE